MNVDNKESERRYGLLSFAAEPGLRRVTDLMRPALWCQAETPIREAATSMATTNHSCVIFEASGEASESFGIMTDSDCRRHVATGHVSVEAPVRAIATVPARVIADTVRASDALLEMVRFGVHHIVVVTADGRPCGVARAIDMASAEIRNPLLVRTAIDAAATIEQLQQASTLLRPTAVELHDAGFPATRTSALLGALIEATVARCIGLEPVFAADRASEPTTSWLLLGSLARGEPLPGSDVDTGMVWAGEENSQRFLEAAASVIAHFESCGLSRCKDGANATDRLFSRTKADWIAAVDHWMSDPDLPGALLLSAVVADSRPVSGVSLGRSMLAEVEHVAANGRFVKRMLEESLTRRPPTGFIKDFVVEAGGEHRGELDLKGQGLWPVIAIGRWIAVSTRMASASTTDRLAHGADCGLLTQDESETLRGAYKVMFEVLFRREVEGVRTSTPVSTFLDPKQLDSFTRRQLRESFRVIAKVQGRLSGELI